MHCTLLSSTNDTGHHAQRGTTDAEQSQQAELRNQTREFAVIMDSLRGVRRADQDEGNPSLVNDLEALLLGCRAQPAAANVHKGVTSQNSPCYPILFLCRAKGMSSFQRALEGPAIFPEKRCTSPILRCRQSYLCCNPNQAAAIRLGEGDGSVEQPPDPCRSACRTYPQASVPHDAVKRGQPDARHEVLLKLHFHVVAPQLNPMYNIVLVC
jgi:hypothetical protein